MRRMRARWVLGTTLLFGAAAASCGGSADGLFTQPSSTASGGALNAGGAGHAGEAPRGGGAGAANHPSDEAGAPSQSGAAQGGAVGHAGAGGSRAAGAGGSRSSAGAGGTAGIGAHAGSAGASGASAGAGGATAGAGGASAGSGGSTAGAGGSLAGAGGSSAGAGGDDAATCADNAGCLPSEYCDKNSCGANAPGHCLPTPSDCEGTKLAVVCGCNGVTYHDACLLHHARTNSASLDSGACAMTDIGTVTCASTFSQTCAGLGGVCGFKTESDCIGAGSTMIGTCWVLPASCPGSDAKTAQPCQDPSCISECDAIQQSLRYGVPDHCN